MARATIRAWYITGALLGGAPLAQGSVYLHLPRKAAHVLTAIAATVIGHTDVLYATELLGLLCIYIGYRLNVSVAVKCEAEGSRELRAARSY